jgi:hypothetical protein
MTDTTQQYALMLKQAAAERRRQIIRDVHAELKSLNLPYDEWLARLESLISERRRKANC